MPANFFPTDASEIRSRIEAAFDSAASSLFPDHRIPGTPGYNLKQVWIRMFQAQYRELNRVYGQMSPRTAEGLGLDAWADFFNEARKGQIPATGTVLLKSPLTGTAIEKLAGTRTIPAGTRLTAGSITLRTLDEVSMPAEARSITVAANADSVFGETAVEAGTTLQLQNAALVGYVTAETLTDISGGISSETDEQLRFRLVNALTNPSTLDGFKVRLLSNTSVAEAELQENIYGPGTIEAFVTPSDAFPSETLRSELESLWQGPGRTYIIFPDYEALVLRIRVTGEVNTALIVDTINNLAVGETFILNALETAIQNAGASDAQVIGIKRGPMLSNGEFADLRTLEQITNVTARSSRSKWFTQSSWITLCS